MAHGIAKTLPRGYASHGAAKLDYLSAGRNRIDPETGVRGGVGVNRTHCRPLHPYGMKMIKEGLMRLTRSGGGSRTKHSALVITDKGLEELARLEKRAAAQSRKFASQEPAPGTAGPGAASRRKACFAAIAFGKRARG
jgi:hypothetical protein